LKPPSCSFCLLISSRRLRFGVTQGRHSMNPQRVKRKLAAILSADAQGYSRLMGDDEAATVQTLTADRRIMAAARNHLSLCPKIPKSSCQLARSVSITRTDKL
jgi:hypothetical protein